MLFPSNGYCLTEVKREAKGKAVSRDGNGRQRRGTRLFNDLKIWTKQAIKKRNKGERGEGGKKKKKKKGTG